MPLRLRLAAVRRAIIGAALVVLLPACAITPPVTPVTARCALDLLPAKVALPEEQLRAFIGSRPTEPLTATANPVDNSLLLLSGGSQHGAFGAGFLAEWSRRRGGLPRFATVTGISTGAILSTWAFVGDPEVMAKEYALESEDQVLRAFARRKRDGDLTLGSYLTIARRGAQADLSPLRARLLRLIDDAMMERIAAEARERTLLIGLVDVDSGDALMVNLGNLAVRHQTTTDPLEKGRLRACYVDSVIASSSVPPAAPPAFIDNRMYIDGGARFGLIGPAFLNVARFAAAGKEAPTMYMLVNSTLETKAQCGRREPDLCQPDGSDPSLNTGHPRRDWDLIDLALRSVDILTGQIYRFSVAALARDYAITTGRKPYFAKIDRDRLMAHRFPRGGPTTCETWKDIDGRTDRPLEFYPRYMTCVVDYGRQRAEAMDWGTRGETRSDEGSLQP
jgi:hypothetical protein